MTQAAEYERLIIDFIREQFLGAGGEEIDPEENLFTSGHIDSVGIMRLIAHLETSLGIEIPPADLVPDNFRTVRVMARYLEGLQG